MKMTSAQAAKLLRKLDEQHKALRHREEQSRTFVAALDEDIEWKASRMLRGSSAMK